MKKLTSRERFNRRIEKAHRTHDRKMSKLYHDYQKASDLVDAEFNKEYHEALEEYNQEIKINSTTI